MNFRAAQGTTSEIVGKIRGGSMIEAKDCSERWCAVTRGEKSGFAIRIALDMSGRVPRSAARPPAYQPRDRYIVDEGPVYYEPPPVYYKGRYYRPYWGYGPGYGYGYGYGYGEGERKKEARWWQRLLRR